MIEFNGKTIIVTGAASGIGRATACLLSKLGARCILFDIDSDALLQTKDMLISQSHLIYQLDLTNSQSIEQIFHEGRNVWGGVHGLVHCAGIPSFTPLRVLNEDMYNRVQNINTLAGLNLAKNFSKRGVYDATSNTCSIVFISSVYGLVGSAANVAYATSKAAVIGMTKSLAVELAPKKIRVNCVAPGFVKTNMAKDMMPVTDELYNDRIEKMHLLGWGDADDIANGIAFLLSNAAKWITGSVLTIDGGFTAQ